MGLSGRPEEEIVKTAAALRKIVVDTYNRGGITTVAWHFSNPASEGGFYWKDGVSKPAMALIKPGTTAPEFSLPEPKSKDPREDSQWMELWKKRHEKWAKTTIAKHSEEGPKISYEDIATPVLEPEPRWYA